MDECEYCGNQAENDVLVDGDYVRLCKECIDKDRMVVVTKPNKIQIDDSYKRPTIKEILSRMSGVKVTKKDPMRVPKLEELRKPKAPEVKEDKPTGVIVLKKIEEIYKL